MRDDFPENGKVQLAKRVGFRCSNPNCRQLTSGPSLSTPEAVNMGVAPRLIYSMSPLQLPVVDDKSSESCH